MVKSSWNRMMVGRKLLHNSITHKISLWSNLSCLFGWNWAFVVCIIYRWVSAKTLDLRLSCTNPKIFTTSREETVNRIGRLEKYSGTMNQNKCKRCVKFVRWTLFWQVLKYFFRKNGMWKNCLHSALITFTYHPVIEMYSFTLNKCLNYICQNIKKKEHVGIRTVHGPARI